MPSHCPDPYCTPFPLHKQLLVAAVGGAVVVIIVGLSCTRHCRCCCHAFLLSPSSLHPVSTPRAVTHGSGWGCCLGGGPQASSVVVVFTIIILLFVVFVVFVIIIIVIVSPFPTIIPLTVSFTLICPCHLASYSPSHPPHSSFQPPPHLLLIPSSSPPHPLLIPQPSTIIVGPIPPTIHPTSSGS